MSFTAAAPGVLLAAGCIKHARKGGDELKRILVLVLVAAALAAMLAAGGCWSP